MGDEKECVDYHIKLGSMQLKKKHFLSCIVKLRV